MNEQYFYSASRKGFFFLSMKALYDDSASGWPEDALAISPRWYETLMTGQSNGRIIVANEYGQPVLSDPPSVTPDELVARAESQKTALMQEAEIIIAPLSRAVKLGLATPDEAQRLERWETYTVLLSRVDTADPSSVDLPPVPE